MRLHRNAANDYSVVVDGKHLARFVRHVEETPAVWRGYRTMSEGIYVKDHWFSEGDILEHVYGAYIEEQPKGTLVFGIDVGFGSELVDLEGRTVVVAEQSKNSGFGKDSSDVSAGSKPYHYYALLNRPPSFENLPFGVMWEWVEAPALNVTTVRSGLPTSRLPYGVFRTMAPVPSLTMEDFEMYHAEHGDGHGQWRLFDAEDEFVKEF